MPFAPANPAHLPPDVLRARRHFSAAGWSMRAAAPVLGVCYQHLSEVLNGHRESSRLLRRILALPDRKEGGK